MGYFDSDAEEMLEIYLLETKQLTGQLSEVLLEAEKNNELGQEDINNIFRVMHTIKSSSAMMGLNNLSLMAHKMEDLFAYYREQYGKIMDPGAELFDLLFAFSDYIEAELEQMTREDYCPTDTRELMDSVEEYLKGATGTQDQEEMPQEEQEAGDAPAVIPSQLLDKEGTIVRVRFEPGCRMENIRAFMLLRQITPLCTEVESFPQDLEKSQGSAGYIEENGSYFRFLAQDRKKVLEVLEKGLFVASCQVVADSGPQAAKEEPVQSEKTGLENKETEYLEVRVDRLDKLQNAAAELTIQMLILEDQLEEYGLTEVKEGTAYQISRLISDVERTVMESRMVRVSKIIPKLRRILRDICRDQGKEAELVINCGDIEADKSVVDYVSEILMHILRNAVDHGIESPQDRLNAGKSRKGRIEFTVRSTVGELVVSIADDGQGLDEKKILARAKERGLLTKDSEEYEGEDIWDLILQPGFTTNDQVTEYSGRGVGLDVVKNVVESAGGHVYISSAAGKGSTFTVAVPLNLATMECIRFRVGRCRFSLPARYVFRFLEYQNCKELISSINGKNYLLLDDKMVPLVDLRGFYGMQGEIPESAIIVYIHGMEREGCIIVDSMYEQKRIVIKPLPALFGPEFRRRTGINGCSIMGNGRICAAVDIEILISRYLKEGRYDTGTE